ncbi:VCBS repeat-containing protein [Muricauda sp. SYSU M84420]|uniref:VCBS repeat-containing protein n=1 Tax=Flagellimonas halotolerans TaxID=3112164 RepID=A0ABU6ISJ6_9FLAO|nr:MULTISPECIES: VCBS repeat-containing protein [unclassified Allomuricauda]MEC3966212.1 VCBS repeat-containing protein [Muricauda sp. SYSU M86414]MEC4266102.1 VCBS repeat-containing protein [Muricauda sp. SYSU M84420]
MKKTLLHIYTVPLFIVVLALFVSCDQTGKELFKLHPPKRSGLHFENTIIENDTVNVFQFMNVYTGAGVAVGDINNDGLPDIYFSGNMVSGRLFLNKGGLRFEDISESAGILNARWGTGATMVDINQDGWLDIYVCVSGGGKESDRANLLYINNGDMTFEERAESYGLADRRQSMQAAFFDYDKDNDLDMYLMVNPAAYEQRVNVSQPRKLNGESISNDRLYHNNGDGTFEDVTLKAGILTEGYGLGIGISDINNDSWPDIYISNDFIGSDILYINQQNGTFKNELSRYINHTSYAGMGNDIADINNDGKPDIVVLDMRPEDNKRQKLIISSTGYDRFQMMLEAGYDPQYSRNTLQLNMGGDEFSEIGFMSGISSTDWSWSPLLADFDNDGSKDLFVTNGFLRDLGNLDYIHYQNIYDNPLGDAQTKIDQKLKSISELPPAKLVNYLYRNKGDLTFENVTKEWGIESPSCSNGAAYADFDNDGDLELVVNNVNQPAFLYENRTSQFDRSNFLRIELRGEKGNLDGIGSRIEVTIDGATQHYEHYLSRGYESAVDRTVHFGLGQSERIDTLEIIWPDNRHQVLVDIPSNQTLRLVQSEASAGSRNSNMGSSPRLFRDVTDSLDVDFKHQEDATVDFKMQSILPHMHSRNGPGIAVGDVDNDGLDDFYVGGAAGSSGQLFLQDSTGDFQEGNLTTEPQFEDMGALFFDADGDQDLDLYVVSGGVSVSNEIELYQDRIYINDGSGNFSRDMALPKIETSGSVVTAADFDHDGDLDLFVGGRVSPGAYPTPAKSYLLENRSDSNSGRINFVDRGPKVPEWGKLTMVTSALWTDFDNDGWRDLIVVGEFMPITIFKNNAGELIYMDQGQTQLPNTNGWWNSIAGGDFDRDGDVDYLVGNLGLNNRYNVSGNTPLSIYAKDFDKDGKMDPIMSQYIHGKEYLVHSRDEIIGQINAMRARFKTYESYSDVTFEESFLPEEIDGSYIIRSTWFESSLLENLGNGQFSISALPKMCQMGPIKGIVVEDFDGDGALDALLTGNSYTTEVSIGRYDAIKGIFLKGNGKGRFTAMTPETSGFLNDWDTNGLSKLGKADGTIYVLVANNDNALKIFDLREDQNQAVRLDIPQGIESAEILLTDGSSYKMEFYHGEGYLSQHGRSMLLNKGIQAIIWKDNKGNSKKIVYEEAFQ